MKVVEFRIALPLDLEWFHRLCLHVVTNASTKEMENGSGIEIFKNEPCEFKGRKGHYTEKRFHLAKNMPAWLQSLLGPDLTVLRELSWNTYPYTFTKYSNNKLTTFEFSVETMNVEGLDQLENAVNLSPADLAYRRVVHVDLTEFSNSKVYDRELDVTLATSQHTDVLPLKPGWMNKPGCKGMICYKVIKLDIPYFGFLASKVENYVVSILQDKMLVYYSGALCHIDDWYNAEIKELKAKEAECYAMLNQQFRERYAHLVADDTSVKPIPTSSEKQPEQECEQDKDKDEDKDKDKVCEQKEEMPSDPIFIPPIELVEERAEDVEFCDCLEESDTISEVVCDVGSASPSGFPTPRAVHSGTAPDDSVGSASMESLSIKGRDDATKQVEGDRKEDMVRAHDKDIKEEGDMSKKPSASQVAKASSTTSSTASKPTKYTPSVFTGYLFKLGGTFFYQWSIRYIVISGGKLYYFDSRENTRPKAAITLTDARIKWVGEYMNRSYVFSITTSSKRISYWSADQEPSVKRWILLLQVLCESSPDALIEDLAAGNLYRPAIMDADIDLYPPTITSVIQGI
ncbi:phosphatidylinositol transfer protein [Babesia gibsoni]|uniref:Phosphatidylinositol transfer protein n=1 Tax=Babesia gibsoni TaxID=33632 RepID=A0AAD8PD52_BABGI|nr:phosphatidylinositol transfer protein [Babesia gibsoni]